jgi:hypothetical protein
MINSISTLSETINWENNRELLSQFIDRWNDPDLSKQEIIDLYIQLHELKIEQELHSLPIYEQVTFASIIWKIDIEGLLQNHFSHPSNWPAIEAYIYIQEILKKIDNYLINIISKPLLGILIESQEWISKNRDAFPNIFWKNALRISQDFIWLRNDNYALESLWKLPQSDNLDNDILHSNVQRQIEELIQIANIELFSPQTNIHNQLIRNIKYLLSKNNLPSNYLNLTTYNTATLNPTYQYDKPNFTNPYPNIKLDIIAIEDINSQAHLFPFEISQDDMKLFQILSTSEATLYIWYNLWFDLLKLNLQIQIYLFQFLIKSNIQTVEKFKNTIQFINTDIQKYSFLNSFLACSKTPKIWDKIIELAKCNWSGEIFEAYAELINLQSEISSEDIDSITFLKSIISRWEKLLLEAHNKGQKWEDLSINKKYSSELVKSWAFVKALISKNKAWKILEKDVFNEKCLYYKIEAFSGWDNIIKSDDQLDLLSEENYISPEIFSKEDYKMIVDNLKEAYHKIDPKWLKILIANISEDLQNPDVTFYIMRDKHTGKLVSLCKSNKWIHEWELYLGTHYVDQDLRWDFGFWDYVLKLAIQENSNINMLTGSVAVNNPDLERHINYWGFSATDIVFDTDKSWNTSWELFKVDINKKVKYISKNKSIYSDEVIKQLSGKPERNNIITYQLDSQSWNDQEFKDICKDKFNNWYALTRLFYEKTWNQSDLSKTYIVFEKNEEL